MCGIAGCLYRSGLRPDAGLLGRMLEQLRHRGPDDCGTHCQGPIGLVQTRLAIIGLDSGHQPLVSADGRLALVANGEVYNDVELNAELSTQGIQPRTASDSETILNAYAAWGLPALERLHGMYAFALYDGRSRVCGLHPTRTHSPGFKETPMNAQYRIRCLRNPLFLDSSCRRNDDRRLVSVSLRASAAPRPLPPGAAP